MKNRDWKIQKKINREIVEANPEYSELYLQLLHNRGIKSKEDISNFLDATYSKDSFNPFLFVDMKEAIELLIDHIKKQNKITIYGDYDADGVTSSVLLVDILRLLNVEVDFYIPDRVSEGYGLNLEALKIIALDRTKLIITVDTGIRNREEVDFLKKNGIDIIITDHHQGPDDKRDYPDCLIINPALPREDLPFTKLSGVGVALKFTQALISRSTLSKDQKDKIENIFFDLAAIGTVADCVSLLGENRLIVKRGLEALSKTKRLGLKELIKIANIKNTKEIDSWNIGFQIAPRINAAGRMDHANTAFALLLCKDKEDAKKLAEELNYNNQMRQKSTEHIFGSVESQIKDPVNSSILTAVYEYQEEEEHKPWNEGIIGLVSGRITEKYYRPSMIITSSEHGYKGSGRSIAEFNIAQALEKSKKYLLKFGGHPLACGFSLEKKDLEPFLESMRSIAKEALAGKDLRPVLNIDCELNFENINEELVDSLSVFKPYGQDNPQPVFLSKNIQVLDKINLGISNQHLKLRLKNGSSNMLSAIGFSQSEKWSHIGIGDLIDIVYNLDINEFNGRREVQLKIIDIQKNDRA